MSVGLVAVGLLARGATAEAYIVNDDLKYGAYRIVSGDDYLVLLGRDTLYFQDKPGGGGPEYPGNRSEREQASQAWQEKHGPKWGSPLTSNFKGYNEELGLWHTDEQGSLNAVNDFLRSLGVRWYMPGEFGEVCPRRESILLKPYELKDVKTGEDVEHKTFFKVAWSGDSLYFGIRCEEPAMDQLKVPALSDGDNTIFNGDSLEIQIETPTHAYYQLAIDPAGHINDLDRPYGNPPSGIGHRDALNRPRRGKAGFGRVRDFRANAPELPHAAQKGRRAAARGFRPASCGQMLIRDTSYPVVNP